jgi:threonine dehydrogenase-like Zn-dependent dehydrogenase
MRSMRAILFGEPGCSPPRNDAPATIRVVEVPKPQNPPRGWVIVKTGWKYKCGSDDKRARGLDGRTAQRWEAWTTSEPVCHEFEGTVVECGEGVDPIDPEQHFAIAPIVPCHNCPACLCGEYVGCNYDFIGSTIAGGFGEFVAVPAKNLFPIPAGVSAKNAGLLEVTAVSLQGLIDCGVISETGGLAKPIESVAVVGAGIIGLITAMILKDLGIKTIMVAHTTAKRRELALSVGATHYNAENETPLAKTTREMFGKKDGFQLVIEAAGTTAAMASAVNAVGLRGTIWWLGTSTGDFNLAVPLQQHLMRMKARTGYAFQSHTGVWPGREWHLAAKLLGAGAIDPAQLVDSECSWETAPAVINEHLAGTNKPLKIAIKP